MISVKNFKGQAPRVNARDLAPDVAQTATNSRLWSGLLEPFAGTRRVYKPSKAGTKRAIYRWAPQANGDAEGDISLVLNTTPVQIVSNGHGLTTGKRVFIGSTGLSIDNDSYNVTFVDANNFSLDGTSAAGTSETGEWTKQNGFWFHWTTLVHAVKAAVGQDTTERTLYTGDGVPKITDSAIATAGGGFDYPNNSYILGVPAPADAATVVAIVNTGNITSISHTTPIQIGTDNPHNLLNGDRVYLQSITTAQSTNLNGKTFFVTVIDPSTLSLDSSEDEVGTTYTGFGTWTQRYEDGDITTRSVVYTYVSGWGEEGPPSAPSNLFDVGPKQKVDISGMSTGPAGNYNITLKRLYIAATGAQGTTYLFLAQLAVAQTTLSNKVIDDAALGESIPSIEWVEPPTDMAGLISLANGVAVGFSKNQVCPSVANQPHAYPVSWRETTDADVVGLGAVHTSVVVLTKGHPYLGDGTDPANLSLVKIENNQSCVSIEGIVSLGTIGVVYPSPDGLIFITPSADWENITEPFFTRNEWNTLIKPSSIRAYALDNRYIAFYDNGTVQGGFIFSPKERQAGLVFLDKYATAGFSDLLSDSLYLQIGDYIERWDSGASNLVFTWKSKKFYAMPRRYSAVKVKANSYQNVMLKIYGDGELLDQRTVVGESVFRFKCRKRFREWEFEISGTDQVYQVVIGPTVKDVARMAGQ